MQTTKKHDTKTDDAKMNDTKMQEKGIQKYGASPATHPSTMPSDAASSRMGSGNVSKHGDEVKHESHKDEYRRDHAKAETGVKNPAAGITGKPEPVATTPAASVMK